MHKSGYLAWIVTPHAVVVYGRGHDRLLDPRVRSASQVASRLLLAATESLGALMSSIRTRVIRARVAGIGVLAAVLVGGLILPSTASATTTTDPVQAAAGWLSTQFEDGTHLPAPAGDHFDSYFSPSYFANYGENADVVFGLAAAKAGATKSGVALDYLAANIDDYADLSAAFGGPFDGSVAKAALAAIVGGRSATNFGGHNLLQTLKDDECAPVSPATTCAVAGPPAGTVPAGSPASIFSSISDSFVILAEARGGGAYTPSTDAVNYFLSLQCSDGGFTGGVTACGAGAADIDSTSYAIMALQALGGHSTELTDAVNWLVAQRGSDGSWNSANVNSTGLAAAALSGQGIDTSGSKTWLLSQQVPAGSRRCGGAEVRRRIQPDRADGRHLALGAGHRAGVDRAGRVWLAGHPDRGRFERGGEPVRSLRRGRFGQRRPGCDPAGHRHRICRR